MSICGSRVYYNSQNGLFERFASHAELGLSKHIQPHKSNLIEKLGNAILWTSEDLPCIVWNRLKAPRVITVALTALSLLGNSFLFYPSKTWLEVKAFVKWLPLPPAWAVRFGAYAFTSLQILGYGLRAYGRFSNAELMNQFYGK